MWGYVDEASNYASIIFDHNSIYASTIGSILDKMWHTVHSNNIHMADQCPWLLLIIIHHLEFISGRDGKNILQATL